MRVNRFASAAIAINRLARIGPLNQPIKPNSKPTTLIDKKIQKGDVIHYTDRRSKAVLEASYGRSDMIPNFPSKSTHGSKGRGCQFSLARTYKALSSASVDTLWQKVTDLADVSWHPLLASTNAPKGLVAKPGLIYRAVTRSIPIPIRIFVEQVRPRELLSVRIMMIPGVEERVTYTVQSTLCGTQISYSITLKGWLSPLIWSLIRPSAARVASELAQAAEQTSS